MRRGERPVVAVVVVALAGNGCLLGLAHRAAGEMEAANTIAVVQGIGLACQLPLAVQSLCALYGGAPDETDTETALFIAGAALFWGAVVYDFTGAMWTGTAREGTSARDYDYPDRPSTRHAITFNLLSSEEVLAYEYALTPAQSLSIGVGSATYETVVPAWRYYIKRTAPLGVFVRIALPISYGDPFRYDVYPSISTGIKGPPARTTGGGTVYEASIGVSFLPHIFPIYVGSVGYVF